MPEYTAECIQQQIIHIETSYPHHKLKHFHAEAYAKRIHQCSAQTLVLARHRHKEAKRDKNKDIASQIRENRKYSQRLTILHKPSDLRKQNQVIAVFPRRPCPSVPIRKQ